MSAAVYLLCAATALLCSSLLLRGYWRTGARLLLWSGLCFVFLTLDNVVLFIDLVLFPEIDLRIFRQCASVTGVALLLYGLVWDTS